jgi:hypothetical protein
MLVEIDRHGSKVEEFDVEGILNFAERVLHGERAVLAAIGVRQPIDLGRRYEERGVLHPQRSKDAFVEEARQRLARRPRDQQPWMFEPRLSPKSW